MKKLNLNLNFKKSGQKSSAENFQSTEFRRVVEINETVHDREAGTSEVITRKSVRMITKSIALRKNFVTLVPMKSLSFEEFSFPFSNSTKIREALKLQVLPFSAAGELEIFPVILSKAGRGVKGLVWYVTPSELEIPAYAFDANISNKFWPAPLPFISRLAQYDGNGVTMWVDEVNICSILWQANKPVLSRWKKFINQEAIDKEFSWYNEYCKAQGLERGGDFIVNAVNNNSADLSEPNEEFIKIISDSVTICPWLENLNLSRKAIKGEQDLERAVNFLTKASCWLLAFGLVTLGAIGLRLYQVNMQTQAIKTRNENFYRQVFDPSHTGRIGNPVTLARNKIAELTGNVGEGHPLEEALADLGEILENEKDLKITLDTVRYNAEGIDCTGSAPDMTTVLNFRKSIENYASTVQVDNTQFVAGIGYRFDLRIRW